jgi:hypothetical protein
VDEHLCGTNLRNGNGLHADIIYAAVHGRPHGRRQGARVRLKRILSSNRHRDILDDIGCEFVSNQGHGIVLGNGMAYSDGAVPYGAGLFGTARPRGGITRLRGRVAPSTSSGRTLGSATVLGRYLGCLGLPSAVRDGQLLSCYAAENFGFSGLNRAD